MTGVSVATHLEMTSFLSISDFDPANLSLGPAISGPSKIYRLHYNTKPIIFQTPWIRSNGINKQNTAETEDINGPTHSVTLYFLGYEFKKFLEGIDEWAINTAYENSWLGANETRESVASKYTSAISDSMKLNLFYSKANGYSTAFFTKDAKQLAPAQVNSYFTMNSTVSGIIRCTGIWVMGDTFGVNWKPEQMVIVGN